MSLVLGVDGGGRKTYAVVTDDDGAVRGAGEAGASNWEIAGTDDAETAIAVAVGAALEEARGVRGLDRRRAPSGSPAWIGPPTARD